MVCKISRLILAINESREVFLCAAVEVGGGGPDLYGGRGTAVGMGQREGRVGCIGGPVQRNARRLACHLCREAGHPPSWRAGQSVNYTFSSHLELIRGLTLIVRVSTQHHTQLSHREMWRYSRDHPAKKITASRSFHPVFTNWMLGIFV